MRLAVNIDHIATLRQARKGHEPEPLAAAVLAELAGAQGITVHLRGDRRHIQDRDVELLQKTISTRLNVEMAATGEMASIAARIKPFQVTLVPERPQELTTEGGLDVIAHATEIDAFITQMHNSAVQVSIFLDPELDQVQKATSVGADAIEINTGRYAEASGAQAMRELERIREAARAGAAAGIEVLAGHGLNYVNVIPIAAIQEIVELNIGHSIVSRASLVGMDRAVRDMVALLSR
ncbi:MAG: pyridoxine 5'-phosphate synthase [Acidobacteriota bacterium]|nr:pyridoxine 5'-phosphate synthase [Acidobacteriota bacterium]MDQ3418947.1 pyridoxine 5'-phosphate synthase [Acidobacteriota bacterium]